MPRAGLTGDDVVVSAAGLADEIGFQGVTMGLLADRLGVRAPSLYKHVGGLADVQHRLATLALTELGEVIRDAVQGRAGRDALAAMMTAVRGYVSAHPGRYAATTGAETTGPDDPLQAASTRVIDSIAAVLRGYGIADGGDDPRHPHHPQHHARLRDTGGLPRVPVGRRSGRELRVDDRLHRSRPAVRISYPGSRLLRRHRQISGRSTWSHGWPSRKARTRREKSARGPGSSVITPL